VVSFLHFVSEIHTSEYKLGKGFECVLVSDATDGYIAEFKRVALDMVTFSEVRFPAEISFLCGLSYHIFRRDFLATFATPLRF
jgi:hypothetical protein